MSFLSSLQFLEQLSQADANRVERALKAAMDSMAYYGASDDDMEVIAALHVQAIKDGMAAFKRTEAEKK
jgi:hypothetical protein